MRIRLFVYISIFASFCLSQELYINQGIDLCCNFISDNNYSSFIKFYKFRDTLSEEQKLMLDINKDIYKSILHYSELILKNQPSDSLYRTYYLIIDIFKNSGEGSEKTAELFSNYFINNLPNSLLVLKNITEEIIVEELVSNIVFVEGNDIKVLSYIKSNNLSNESYYKYFKIYEY